MKMKSNVHSALNYSEYMRTNGKTVYIVCTHGFLLIDCPGCRGLTSVLISCAEIEAVAAQLRSRVGS